MTSDVPLRHTVDGKTYVFFKDSTHLTEGGMENPMYKCNQCAAKTLHPDEEHPNRTGLSDAGLRVHNTLYMRAPSPPDSLRCHGGFWVLDTEEELTKAVAGMLERA
jgi:hypothetical protein